ncbi:MAG TPA: hypothetical protein VF615_25555 [Longimicrobiaceae bacterium]|jgi:hypothetical protein
MVELPRRPTELPVEISGGKVTLYMEPLTDEQYLVINETADLQGEGDDARLVFRGSRVPGLFEDRFRRAEGVQLAEGGALDPTNPEHVRRIPQPWRAVAIARLIRFSMGLSETERGNSAAQAPSSFTEETPSPG